MGFAKRNSEPEINSTQPGFSSKAGSSQRQRRSNVKLTPFSKETPENMPMPDLLRLVWIRMRRSWIAFRFQFNRYSMGLFNRNALLKAGALAGLIYFLMMPIGEEESGFASRSIFGSGKTVETSLDVVPGNEKAKLSKRSRQNEAAPVTASEIAGDRSTEYIERYHKIAIGEMEKYGIPASISLAQGLIESRGGTSKLAVNNNNHFGIKCFSKRCGKGHCSNFTDDTHKDFFRKFQSPWESWREHSKILASGRYKKLKKYGHDYRQWAYGLKSVGYATDRTYAEKLIGIIERYDLHHFDR
ncbi:MAG: glucosaminidase domain-containing protein [Saprospiraceae bacterium]|nr:glucosaminidase domain-containing protein [Saprospiraceae bacterium]